MVMQDQTSLNVIPRARFQRMLENLPLGLLPFEIEEIFESDLNFDNYGNVDYTVILNSDIFVTLERQKHRKEQLMKRTVASDIGQDGSHIGGNKSESDKLTDNRKVVVEDLVYIDDLEILIYTTISPKTSTIFVSHTKKAESESKGVEVLTL